jgi:hypothetical protein
MSLQRTFKAIGLAVALFATSQAVSAQPQAWAWCCTFDCNLVFWNECPFPNGYLTEEECHRKCPL